MQLIFGDEGSGDDEMEEEEDERSANLVGLVTSVMESRHNFGKKVLVVLVVVPVLGW